MGLSFHLPRTKMARYPGQAANDRGEAVAGINPPHARTGGAGGATQCQERMIVGLVDNEYPSGSSMSASVIICIVLLGLIPKSKLLGSGWSSGVSPSRPSRL